MSKVKEQVEELVLPILNEEELELVDISFGKEGKNRVLRVLIDRIGGRVGIDDCTRVSEQLNKELDRTDLISGAYMLRSFFSRCGTSPQKGTGFPDRNWKTCSYNHL